MIALVISTTSVSYVFVFPALISLRRKHPDAARPYRVPGGMAGAWAAVAVPDRGGGMGFSSAPGTPIPLLTC